MMEAVLSEKALALYDAVRALVEEGADLRETTVADITGKANIGKGTAYDYFENKEDIIASALFYYMTKICGEMMDKMEKLPDFRHKFLFLMENMEDKIDRQGCFMRVINLMTDCSAVSRRLQEKCRNRGKGRYLPEDLITSLVRSGVEKGEVTVGLPLDSVGLSVASRLIAYVLYLHTEHVQDADTDGGRACGPDIMKEQLCESVCRELGIGA